ncbi:DNA-directed RNA polymerase I subunit RPA49 isoform X1 [Hydra vulgaris]|uniref:DNA-directed RNA polymerase I subunit RPA49 n=1 Tax=Hydra vulgaris TaxID=6087 RepID=T2M6C7_HYDVU|nr:DNA-directed RNA polymerase I subunit RPA49 isoform X1 [Hydra vulgaris]
MSSSEDIRSEDARPILVQFENGQLKSSTDIKFQLIRSKNPKSNKRMLIADTKALGYIGTITQKQQNCLKYYVGVVNKKTKTIESVEECQLCTLKPYLSDKRTEANIVPLTTYKEKVDSLLATFGSAKQKSLFKSRKKHEAVKATISDKVINIASDIVKDIPFSPEKSEPVQDFFVIPPKYDDATRVEELFHIDDIIDYKHYQHLKIHSKPILECNQEILEKWQLEKTYNDFVLHHISMLPTNRLEREERSCYLLYLHFLMVLFKLPYKDIRKKDPCPSIPLEVKRYMLDMFTASDGRYRTIPTKYKDKLLCYILVLSLIIEGFQMDCNLLLKDLKLTVPKLTQLLRAIGCTVRSTPAEKNEEGITTDVPKLIAYLTLPKKSNDELHNKKINDELQSKKTEESLLLTLKQEEM